MKPILVLVTLFAASLVAVIAGYYNTLFGLSMFPIKLVLSEVSAFRAAFVLTLLCPAILLASFWSSRGDKGTYQNAVLGWSFLAPIPVALLLLPGEQAKPEATAFNIEVLLFLVCASQMVSARVLREWFWKKGAPP